MAFLNPMKFTAGKGQLMAEFVKVAHVNDLPPGARLFYDFADETVIVFNIGGNYYCIADLCTHDEGPLEDATLEGHEVECPRHGGRFDVRSGHATCFPATEPVPTYAVKVENNYIYVQSPDS